MSDVGKPKDKESLFTIISATILVGAETVGVSYATGWAIGGWLKLGPTLTTLVEASFFALGCWLMYKFYRLAKTNVQLS